MKKRILSLFLAFSLAAGIGVVGAGNNAEARTNEMSVGGLTFDGTDIDGNYVYTLSNADMVNTIGSFWAYPTQGLRNSIGMPSDTAWSTMPDSEASGLGRIQSAAGVTAYDGKPTGSALEAQAKWLWAFQNGATLPNGAKTTLKNGTFKFGALTPNTPGQMAVNSGNSYVTGAPDLSIKVVVPKGVFVSAGAYAGTRFGSQVGSTGLSHAENRNGSYSFVGMTNKEGLLPKLVSTGGYFAGYTPSGSTVNATVAGSLKVYEGTANTNPTYRANMLASNAAIILLDYTDIIKNSSAAPTVYKNASESFVYSSDMFGYAVVANAAGVTGDQLLPGLELDGVKYDKWQELDYQGRAVASEYVDRYSKIGAGTGANINKLRVFKLIDDGNTNPITPIGDPDNKSTISGTGKYGSTLKATDAYSQDGTMYTWYRGIFYKTDSATDKAHRGETLLRQSAVKSQAPNEYIITDIYADYSEHADLRTKGYKPAEWDFRQGAGQTLADNEEYRVWCVITRTNGLGQYSTRNTKVERTILDRTDFVYGTNQESYVTWKAGIGDNESDIIDPVFRNSSNADIPVALRNGLSSQGYYFEIRYRDADQAKEVDAGDVNAAKTSARAASNYYVDGTLEQSLNGQMSINGQSANRGTTTGYGYNFLTGEELRKSGQVGKYEVYVVGIYQNTDHKAPNFKSNGDYKVGVNGEITSATSASGQAYDTNGNMAVRNQNNSLKLANITYDDMRWGYALKDDDSAETLGNKTGHNVPALMIGTLNIQKAKWPASAGLHVAADDNGLPEYDNQTGYLVDNTFDVTEVNVPEKWAKLDTFEWFRVDKNGNWESTGKTGRKYTAGAADVGYYLGVRASNNNYEGTIEGTTHQVIAKRELTVNFTKGSAYREGHFSNGGQFTVDMRSLLAPYGDALGDVTMELKTNVSGEGTIEKAVYSASDKNLVITFKSFDSVPATFAPYTVSGAIEFPGYIINVKGDVRGTAADVNKIVIEPIETKEYDGVGVATTAKVYVNEVEVTDGSNVAIRYEGIDVNYNDTKGPSNRGKYKAVATWKDQTADAEFQIKRRKLTAGDSIAKQYNVGANLPQNLTGYFNIVQKDNVQVHNFVTKFNIANAGVNTNLPWDTARNTGLGGNNNYVYDKVLNKVFYTPTFDIGGNYWMQFRLSGTPDALDNYTAPDAIAIQVGSGYTNASSSNVSTSDPYAEQIAKINREWKAGDVHRMRYAANGEYLYTSDKNEAITNVRNGWTFEAALFKGLAQGTANAKELVRLEKNGERVTTIKGTNEYNVLIGRGYVDNGLIAYVYDSAVEGAIQYNRLYHPRTGLHLVQNVADNEYKSLLEGGTWQDEGAQFWALVP